MITLSAEQPYGIKQLAAVILKNFIKKHWQARPVYTAEGNCPF